MKIEHICKYNKKIFYVCKNDNLFVIMSRVKYNDCQNVTIFKKLFLNLSICFLWIYSAGTELA